MSILATFFTFLVDVSVDVKSLVKNIPHLLANDYIQFMAVI